MPNKFQQLALTESVRSAQAHYGSRQHYAKFEKTADQNYLIGDAESDFIESRDGFYLATVSEDGQPYIQFRGGPRGFLKVIDERTLGYADFRGNLQYISVGNLAENNKAAFFLMDYANKRRLKIFAEVEIKDVSDDPDLAKQITVEGYTAKVERVFLIHVKAFDWNCPQHITERFTIDEVRAMVQPLNEHIEKLERELATLKGEK